MVIFSGIFTHKLLTWQTRRGLRSKMSAFNINYLCSPVIAVYAYSAASY